MGAVPGLADPAAPDEGRTAGEPLLAPFPWFGGKRRIASLVWERFGDVQNYVEPFAGSLAVLLGRPNVAGVETVNDKNAYIANFWRAIAAAPDLVAYHADWPVNETDHVARHAWLTARQAGLRDLMERDPEYFDAKIAGWWVWGIPQWIGGGWCERPEWRGRWGGYRAPRGINGLQLEERIPAYFDALGRRLRGVRVACGDWARILKPSPTTCVGITGVLLDPPYAGVDRDEVYAGDSMFLAHEVAEWAVHHGDNPRFRIALCGYAGEHEMPATWTCVRWKAAGGYSNAAASSRRGRTNAGRERVWFSKFCINSGCDPRN